MAVKKFEVRRDIREIADQIEGWIRQGGLKAKTSSEDGAVEVEGFNREKVKGLEELVQLLDFV